MRKLGILSIIGRYTTALLTLLIIIMITRGFSLEDFRTYAASLSVAGILIWITDLGSTNQMVIEIGRRNSQKFTATLANKLTGTLIGLSLVLIFTSIFEFTFFNPMLFVGLTLDAFIDSIYLVRQVKLSMRESAWIPVARKFVIFLSLGIFSLANSGLTLNFVIFVYILVCTVFLSLDLYRLRPIKIGLDFSQIAMGARIWIQYGGHALAGLDLFILSGSSYFNTLPVLISSKRISNTLALPSTLLGNRILHDLSKDLSQTKNVISSTKLLRKKLFSIAIIMSLIVPYFSLGIFGINRTPQNYIFQSIFIINSSILALNILFNNILIATNDFSGAAKANYASGIFLLSTVAIFLQFDLSIVLLSITYLLSSSLELLINQRGIKKYIELKGNTNEFDS